MKQETLSSKRKCNPNDITEGYYPEQDVKESIKELKEKFRYGGLFTGICINEEIDKIFGEKLI